MAKKAPATKTTVKKPAAITQELHDAALARSAETGNEEYFKTWPTVWKEWRLVEIKREGDRVTEVWTRPQMRGAATAPVTAGSLP